MWEYEWWTLDKTKSTGKQHIRENFPYRFSLAIEQLFKGIKKRNLSGYVRCDTELPENLRANFDNFPPLFNNTLVWKNDIRNLMKIYALAKMLLCQPRKLLLSSFTLQKGTLITPLLWFYLQFGLVCTKIHRFVEYTPKRICNSFVQSAVDAIRQGDENPNSSVVSETMNLPANTQLADHKQALTHCNEVPQWQKNTCS